MAIELFDLYSRAIFRYLSTTLKIPDLQLLLELRFSFKYKVVKPSSDTTCEEIKHFHAKPKRREEERFKL
jgi:hypothetical protein